MSDASPLFSKKLPFNKNFVLLAGLLLSLMPLSTLSALELNLGVGQFTINQSIKPLFSNQIRLDLNTLSLSENHQKLGHSKFYYNFNLEYFDSDTLNKITDFSSKPLTSPIPFIGDSISDRVADYTQLPVPADYRMHGINFDLGLGYELLKEPLINLDEFWQRQVFKFEALVLSIVILWFKPITKKLETWLSPTG